MPIPVITDGIQAPQIQGPLDTYAKGVQLKSLLGQQQLQQQQIQEGQESLATRQALRQGYKDAITQGADGQPTIDFDKLGKSLAAAGHGDVVPEIQKSAMAFQEAKGKLLKQSQELQVGSQDMIGHAAAAIQRANYDPRVAHTLLDTLPNSPQTQQMRQLIDGDPAQFKQMVDTAKAASPEQQKFQNAKDVADIRSDKLPTSASLAVDAAGTDPAKAAQAKAALAVLAEQKPDKNDTEATLALKSAQGDQTAEAALRRLDKSKLASRPVNVTANSTDAKDIANAIENGDQPPTLTGLYKNAAPVRAELARRGVPIAKMELDWKATQKYINTLNGSQQTRLRQDIATTSDTLDKVEGLYNEWKALAPQTGYKVLNKGTLLAMKNLPGRPGAVATALEAQIADTTAGLGTIYMGGNSPTDHSLGLAAKALSADWNDETFTEGLKQARSNIKIRQNSMLHAAPAGASSDNPYAPSNAEGGSASQSATSGKHQTFAEWKASQQK